MTTPLPVNKHGEIYYGPKTYAEAENLLSSGKCEMNAVVNMLKHSGYDRVATAIIDNYQLDEYTCRYRNKVHKVWARDINSAERQFCRAFHLRADTDGDSLVINGEQGSVSFLAGPDLS